MSFPDETELQQNCNRMATEWADSALTGQHSLLKKVNIGRRPSGRKMINDCDQKMRKGC